MNKKMNKKLLILLTIISLVSAFDYQISAQLGEQNFKTIEGDVTFKMMTEDGNVFNLRANKLSPGSMHFQIIGNAPNHDFKKIESVNASFEVDKPSKLFPEYIYLKSLSIIHFNEKYKDKQYELIKKIYTPIDSSIPIKRNQIIKLNTTITNE